MFFFCFLFDIMSSRSMRRTTLRALCLIFAEIRSGSGAVAQIDEPELVRRKRHPIVRFRFRFTKRNETGNETPDRGLIKIVRRRVRAARAAPRVARHLQVATRNEKD